MVALFTVFLARREVHALLCTIGLLASNAFSSVLKRLLSNVEVLRPLCERPPGCDRTDAGLPSSHAQFVGFFLGYARALNLPSVELGALGAGAAVCASRVYLGYHTWLQVAFGAVLGLVMGWLGGEVSRRHVAPVIESSTLGAKMHLRDSTQVPDMFAHERRLTLQMRAKAS